MFWLKLISNFLKILRAGQSPRQIAGGFALGAIVGLSPSFTLQGFVVWVIIFVLDVNLSAAFLSFTLFTIVAYLFDPLFHGFGYFLLVSVPSLQGFWTALYNAPLAPLTRFNNTIVLGSFLGALILFLPIFFGMQRLVVAYRAHIGARVEQWKIYQVVSKSAVARWYIRVRSWGEFK